ncbi:hypothetical protein ACHAXA_010396 [Cyclostephanos tholiformis]|uniref:gamma-glutamylcyclotransferase n=1 Tax=Cyclostephanos tholiformis TaxID=382380 RepID=A0ABD3SF77_9STRA
MTKSERKREMRRDRPSSRSPPLLLPPAATCFPTLLLLLLSLLDPSNHATTSFLFSHGLATPEYDNNHHNNNNQSGRVGRSKRTKTYNYFAYGSNMASSTMNNLRNIVPISSPRFNVPGLPLVEPSYASVEPTGGCRDDEGDDDDAASSRHTSTNVHGVLYELSETDFGIVCRTEGVPFVYALHRCVVLPYEGDGKTAGEDALFMATRPSPNDDDGESVLRGGGVMAFTLRAAGGIWRMPGAGRDIPPSRSYINVLVRGAREHALDDSYARELERIRCGRTLIGDGISEEMLRVAECSRRRSSVKRS